VRARAGSPAQGPGAGSGDQGVLELGPRGDLVIADDRGAAPQR